MSQRILHAGAFAAFAAAFLLVWQFLIALGIGDEIALLSKSVDPARMTSFFQIDVRALTQLMTADDMFALAYAIAFIVLALYLMPRAKLVSTLALVFAVLTALIDLMENSLLLASVEQVAQNQSLDAHALVVLFWLGQIKYLAIYLASILFALVLWEVGATGKILAALLVLFVLIGVGSIALDALTLVKVAWMELLLIVGGIFLVLEAKKNQT